MREEDFRHVIADWSNKELPAVISRDVRVDISADKVIVIAGIRRAGKTYLVFDMIKELLKDGIGRSNILYVNFDDERLRGMDANDLNTMLDVFNELSAPDMKKKAYLFLDEIQEVKDWEKWVRRIYETKKYKVIITGSSSKLLSAEIATSMVGRSISYLLYPFSFSEFLAAKNLKIRSTTLYTDISAVNRYLKEYLVFGGFPELAFDMSEDLKLRVLSSYYNAILHRDIVDRFRISDPNSLVTVFRYIASTYSKSFSSSKMYNYFRSIGMKISKKTLSNFVKYGESVFLFSQLYQLSRGFKRSYQSRKKMYLTDTGIAKLFESETQYGRLLENMVYVELLRRKEARQSVDIN
ncbi:MAG: ATP-binding protein, partial [Candidatus Micrarchaeota archaeon]|nr:ATP-binding protein [Candidatus Micrarchaeota archaeon]